MNIFLKTYSDMWLTVENVGHEQLIEDNTESFEEAEKKTEEEHSDKPDPVTQLVTGFSRAATTEHGGPMKEDSLYMDYAFIFSQICSGAEEEEGGEEVVHQYTNRKWRNRSCSSNRRGSNTEVSPKWSYFT
jgi:hypothetical protein